MKEGRGRRKYDKQFKEEAVRLVTEGGRKVTEVARSLGIHENLLRTWKRKYKEDPAGRFPGKGQYERNTSTYSIWRHNGFTKPIEC